MNKAGVYLVASLFVLVLIPPDVSSQELRLAPSVAGEADRTQQVALRHVPTSPNGHRLLGLGSPPKADVELQGVLAGVVTDAESGRLLGAVQVAITELGLGAPTDSQGRYSISNVPAGSHVVRITFLGYQSEARTIDMISGETVTLNVSLNRTALALDGVVVTGTAGGARQREVGSAVGQVDGSQLAMMGTGNLQEALQGQVSGLTISQGNPQGGAPPTFALRGSNSVSQGDAPLVYVDGVRMYARTAQTMTQGSAAHFNPISNIRPQDIERIEVVRGPAATTLYGTEASGGVIQIFTRRGSTGQAAQWYASATTGLTTMGHVGPKKDNPDGFGFNNCADRVNSLGTRFTDVTCPSHGSWIKPAALQRYSVGVDGGVGGFTYALSTNVGDEGAPIDGSTVGVDRTGYNRDLGFRANFTLDLGSSLMLQWTSSLNTATTKWVPAGAQGAWQWSIHMSRGLQGQIRQDGQPASARGFLIDTYDRKRQVMTGVALEHNPTPRFNHRISVGHDASQNLATSWLPVGHWNWPTGQYHEVNWRAGTLTLDYGANFRAALPDRGITSTTSAGFQAYEEIERVFQLRVEDFAGPMSVPTLVSGAQRLVVRDDQLRVINAGMYFQQLVGFNDYFFLTAGARVDGNSAFGSGFGLQMYPKLSASYVLSDMGFWPDGPAWPELMRLRGSVGEAGKAPGAFDAVRSWAPIVGDANKAGFSPGAIGDSNLGPERAREYELGFDASFLEGRITAEASVYRQQTFDALIPVQQPASLGFVDAQLSNVGKLQNQGAEIDLSLELVRRPNFNWNLGLMASQSNSEALDLGGQEIQMGTRGGWVREGYPVPSYFGHKVLNPDEYAAPIIDTDAYIGAAYPTRTLSFRTSMTILNNITMSAVGEHQGGAHVQNQTSFRLAQRDVFGPCYAAQQAQRAAMQGDPSAWSTVPARMRARCTVVPTEQEVWLYIDPIDHFMLRSVNLGYQLPDGLLPGTRSAALNFSATNLWTSTDYEGTHPNATAGAGFPAVDYHGLAPYRTFTVSLNVAF